MNTRTLVGPLGVSLTAAAIILIAVIVLAPPVVGALVTSAGDADLEQSRIATLQSEHGDEADLYEARFQGRSGFFKPDPPRPEPVETNQGPVDQPDQEQRGPAPNYGGALKRPDSIIGDVVHFADGDRWMRVGETAGGVRLVRVDPPWTVTVAWTAPASPTARFEEGEYALPVFPKGEAAVAMPAEPPGGPGAMRGLRDTPPERRFEPPRQGRPLTEEEIAEAQAEAEEDDGEVELSEEEEEWIDDDGDGSTDNDATEDEIIDDEDLDEDEDLDDEDEFEDDEDLDDPGEDEDEDVDEFDDEEDDDDDDDADQGDRVRD